MLIPSKPLVFFGVQAEENLGMAMVFTIYSAVQEKLDSLVLKIAVDEREAREKKIKEEEEAERVKMIFINLALIT